MGYVMNVIGKHGELFQCERIETDDYLVDCFELDIENKLMTNEEVNGLIDKYQIKGVPDSTRQIKKK